MFSIWPQFGLAETVVMLNRSNLSLPAHHCKDKPLYSILMHIHTIQLSTMWCVCIISVLFVFEKLLMVCVIHTIDPLYVYASVWTLILWSTALYSSMAAASSSLLFYFSLPLPVVLFHRLTSCVHFLPAFPISCGFGRCVCESCCVCQTPWVLYTSAVCRPIKPVQTLDCFCSPHWLSSTLITHTYFCLV